MVRRITAALLALVILIFALPAEVYAMVYEIGQQLWITGTSQPTEETVTGSKWFPVVGEDGVWEKRTGQCPKQAHSHVTACYDTQGLLICGLEEHKHTPICSMLNAEYLWEVRPESAGSSSSGSGDSGSGGSGSDDSGSDETVTGAASFAVRNIDTVGKPLVGSEFYLLEPKEGENAVVRGNASTDENGEICFDNIYLEEGINSATWQVAQNMPPENDLSNYYRPNTDKWNVNIVRNADGTHSLDIGLSTESAAAAAEETEYEQGYDPETGILTVINEPLFGSLLINVHFEGFADDQIPGGMTLRVTVAGPDGYEEIIEFPVDRVGYTPWQAELENLTLGDYRITGVEAAQAEGYTMEEPVIQVELPGEDPAEEASIALNKEHAYATFTIINRYTAEEEPSLPAEEPDGPSNTVIVKTVDDLGNGLSGAAFELINKKTSESVMKLEDDSKFVLDLEDYAVEGQTVTYSLQQTKAPAGYKLSEDSYTIEIKMKNGEVTVTLKKDAGILATLFSGNSIELGSNGEQLAIFTNVRKTTQIDLELDVAVDFMKGSWKDKALMREYQDAKYEFLLTWEDDGEQQQESLKLEHGESKTFKAEIPYGAEYQVSAVNEDGYYYTYFSGENDGSVGLTQLKENIQVTATNEYVIEAGDDLDLYMVKIDSSTKKPLEDAKFTLKDEEGDELKTYKTDEEGEIDIVNLLDTPGTYTLTETQAPEGYDKLNQAIKIVVTAEYDLKATGTHPILEQNMTAGISHRSVTLQSDGTYQIVNTLSTDNPKTGDASDIHFWTWGMVASAVGLAAIMTEMSRKKHRAQ